MSFSSQRFLVSLILTLFIVVGFVATSQVFAVPGARNKRLLQDIAKYEVNPALTDKQWYGLAQRHQIIADCYQHFSHALSEASVAMALTLSDSGEHGRGSEYFGMLGALSLGLSQDNVRFTNLPTSFKNTPQPFRHLCQILSGPAGSADSYGGARTFWDSLEVFAGAGSGDCLQGVNPSLTDPPDIRDADMSALISRARLKEALCENNPSSLALVTGELDRRGIPPTTVTYADGFTQSFSDPALVALLAQAHYALADHAYSQAQKSDVIAERSLTRRLSMAISAGNLTGVEELIAEAGSIPVHRALSGWVNWKTGNKSAAFKNWKQVRTDSNYREKLVLFHAWTSLPELYDSTRALSEDLIASLGNRKERMALKNTNSGSQKIWRIHSASAAWLLKRGEYLSAWRMFNEGQIGREFNLDYYRPDDLAAYHNAQTLSGLLGETGDDNRHDFLTLGYSGWLEFAESYPVIHSIKSPLDFVIIGAGAKLVE